jgi:[protein-PII] uridylyltransferase
VTIAVVPKVTIDNSSSPACSVIELHASDQLGLLHRVTEALFDCKLDVVAARVSTLDDAVIDVFYVRGATGSKVTDPSELESLQRTLRDAAS